MESKAECATLAHGARKNTKKTKTNTSDHYMDEDYPARPEIQ